MSHMEDVENIEVTEFDHYDSLDDELAGDHQVPSPPKERQLASMRLEAKVEAIIFASQRPLKASDILDILGDPTVGEGDIQLTLDQLVTQYEDRSGGFRLHYLKRLGYQFQTSESAGAIMERMFASRPRPISRAALETLAIIAYRQPVTRAEVEFIRGVDAGSIFKTLLERDLIKCVGRKEIVGRPMLFGTTDQFLTVFNLSSIKDLPPLESFQPSREMVQGAMARIEGGSADDLVDVEEYIADNTRGEYDGDDLAATLTGSHDQLDLDESVAGVADGANENSEVVVPDGDSLSPGGGDLDT
ncbi:MAG: SMC-Scp complex subunit ScpB [Deltaproteobacteria bacterium]|nr:SMC-Scp complex subunit ScpB [Deltaproteobacteria bacterium]